MAHKGRGVPALFAPNRLRKFCPCRPPLTELLDCKYANLTVRTRAVEWLDRPLSDEKLGQYLLQLVQTLKFEHHRDNP